MELPLYWQVVRDIIKSESASFLNDGHTLEVWNKYFDYVRILEILILICLLCYSSRFSLNTTANTSAIILKLLNTLVLNMSNRHRELNWISFINTTLRVSPQFSRTGQSNVSDPPRRYRYSSNNTPDSRLWNHQAVPRPEQLPPFMDVTVHLREHLHKYQQWWKCSK